MRRIFVYIFLFHSFEIISSSLSNIPVIHNATLQVLDYNSTTINGTCQECLCVMLLSETPISAFNCFQNNETCEMFFKSLTINSISLMNNSASSVYFILLPINDTIWTVATIADITNSSTSKLLLKCGIHTDDGDATPGHSNLGV
jgi:hypothetical protein